MAVYDEAYNARMDRMLSLMERMMTAVEGGSPKKPKPVEHDTVDPIPESRGMPRPYVS